MKKLKGFTLVEMLVVMGILIILMTMGIAAGRFAIRRANQIQHQNAADQLYQGLQSYYADNREFPQNTGTVGAFNSWSEALADGGVLSKYIDTNSFDGGSDATFYYSADATGQSVLVCTTFGGVDDVQEMGGYCNGNGFGVLPEGASQVANKVMDATGFEVVSGNTGSAAGLFVAQNWKASLKGWE